MTLIGNDPLSLIQASETAEESRFLAALAPADDVAKTNIAAILEQRDIQNVCNL